MSDDVLHGSEWDDAVSANPGAFGELDKNIVDELSSTFAGTALKDKEGQDQETETLENTDDNHETIDTETSTENTSSLKDLQQSDDVKKVDTSGLLSSLTADADKGFIAESFKTPKKNESLFNDPGLSLGVDVDQKKESSEEQGEIQQPLSSPTKPANRRKNVYRAPRVRRVPLKQQKYTQDKDDDNANANDKGEQDALGPLGSTDDSNDKINNTEISTADQLLKAADGPLFEINRTPLSPLKRTDGLVPAGVTIANSEHSGESDPKLHLQQELEQSQLDQKKKIESSPAFKLDISVGDPIKVGDLTAAHIVYSVRTNTESDLLRSPQTVVSRRYRDFRWLYRQLQSTHPGRIIPPPPNKQAVGRFNEDFIETRRFALERMLVKLAQNPVLQKDPDFIMFLQSERFTSEAREREKAAGISSTFTSVDETNDGSLNNNNGFLSSIGGAFSFTPKLVEVDEYFKEKKSYIEALDQQIKVYLKNLETVVIQRNDLSIVTEEFANILTTLADLEVSKGTTEIFQEFAATQSRIKQLLDRLSLQDLLTINLTLDEYERLINSIKTTFHQRDKILTQLHTSESELKKKQATYDKFFKYNRTHTEKLELLKNELDSSETKYQAIKTKFENISNTIREELAGFEVEKIHDFRNSIEIFLESTIESQKEAVELWETFYNVSLSAA